MKIILISIAVIVISFMAYFALLGFNSKSGKALGLVNDRLGICPNKPNCICSEFSDDTSHYVKPFILKEDAMEKLIRIISDLGGVINQNNDKYLAATFTSQLFGFVDDLELRIDLNDEVIHVRSASREGHSDMSVNSKRVEEIRRLYEN